MMPQDGKPSKFARGHFGPILIALVLLCACQQGHEGGTPAPSDQTRAGFGRPEGVPVSTKETEEIAIAYQFSSYEKQFDNALQHQEKWIRGIVSSNSPQGWYFLAWDCNLFAWNGSAPLTTANLHIATLDPAYCAHPHRLVDLYKPLTARIMVPAYLDWTLNLMKLGTPLAWEQPIPLAPGVLPNDKETVSRLQSVMRFCPGDNLIEWDNWKGLNERWLINNSEFSRYSHGFAYSYITLEGGNSVIYGYRNSGKTGPDTVIAIIAGADAYHTRGASLTQTLGFTRVFFDAMVQSIPGLGYNQTKGTYLFDLAKARSSLFRIAVYDRPILHGDHLLIGVDPSTPVRDSFALLGFASPNQLPGTVPQEVHPLGSSRYPMTVYVYPHSAQCQ